MISAIGRSIPSLQQGFEIPNVLQTDAAINPGNSGGPLLDAQGRVIGVNSQIETGGTGSGNIGIGFAVPVDTVKEVVPRLRKDGRIERAYLGVATRTIDDSLDVARPAGRRRRARRERHAGQPGRPRRPARRHAHLATSAATSCASAATSSARSTASACKTSDDVARLIGLKRPGDSVKITVLRGDDERDADGPARQAPGRGGAGQWVARP